MLPPLRPVSRDLPPLPGSSTPESLHSRPGSSHLNFSNLSTIGEGSPTKPAMQTKKKRRSSFSDLNAANESRIMPSWSPSQLRQPSSFQQVAKTLPRTPSPTKLTFGQESKNSTQSSASPQRSGLPTRFGSPQRLGSPERLGPLERLGSPERFGSPRRKENSPMVAPITQSRKVVSKNESDDAMTATLSPKKTTNPQSGIPAPRSGLTERALPPNGATPPKKLPQPSQKLRMQSPQKVLWNWFLLCLDCLNYGFILNHHSCGSDSAVNKTKSAARKQAYKPTLPKSAKSCPRSRYCAHQPNRPTPNHPPPLPAAHNRQSIPSPLRCLT